MPEGPAPSDPAQLVLCDDTSGLRPGLAISVEPRGMPAGCVDCAASGYVAPMPTVGAMPDDVA